MFRRAFLVNQLNLLEMCWKSISSVYPAIQILASQVLSDTGSLKLVAGFSFALCSILCFILLIYASSLSSYSFPSFCIFFSEYVVICLNFYLFSNKFCRNFYFLINSSISGQFYDFKFFWVLLFNYFGSCEKFFRKRTETRHASGSPKMSSRQLGS